MALLFEVLESFEWEVMKLDLEAIQRRWYVGGQIDSDEVEWLIQQAEKVKELEEIITDRTNDIIHQQKEIERYEKVLEFYADKENYEEWNDNVDLTGYIHNVDFDEGYKARRALNRLIADDMPFDS